MEVPGKCLSRTGEELECIDLSLQDMHHGALSHCQHCRTHQYNWHIFQIQCMHPIFLAFYAMDWNLNVFLHIDELILHMDTA